MLQLAIDDQEAGKKQHSEHDVGQVRASEAQQLRRASLLFLDKQFVLVLAFLA